MNNTCSCGNHMKETIKSATHFIFGREIKILNVPHYHCNNCDKSTYGIYEFLIWQLLTDAYRLNEAEIEFKG